MPKYVYICAAGHSGSTLLDMVLGSHSQIESLGEISFLSQNIAINLRCSCGVPVKECEVWRTVIGKLSTRLDVDLMEQPYRLDMGRHILAHVTVDKSLQTPFYLLQRRLVLGLNYLQLRFGMSFVAPWVQSIERSLANNFLVFDAMREVQGADLVVDSSKSYLKAVGLYRQAPKEVRIILLSRDGRGVLQSNLKRGRPRAKSVSDWINHYARALPLLRRHVDPAHLLHIKYEDFATDPQREMARACAFLGLPFEPGMLDFAAVPHHLTDGNDIRFLKSSTIRADEKWRQELSAQDLRYFEARAGALNRELGYS